ncbi:MAG TPA: OB-fold nucleic acid binding domain-containing protein [Candidatus Nanoarchaeia archaeon]|nr:OB-fold nucleic acid binding domain-containing protein [Candidatus Nanoarchaeia archaeon]
MQEKTITIVSVIIIVLGLSFLAFYMDEFKGQVVESIDNIPAAEKVFIQGRVNRVSLNDKVIFLEVEGKKIETMDIVVFGEDNLFIKEGDLVEISGIVEEYQGKKEVIAEEIVVK